MDITPNLDGGILKSILIEGNATNKPHKGCYNIIKAFVNVTVK